MAWKGDSTAKYTGASGQMAVMGELLHRKCNAIPVVDVGMDVFAFTDNREEVARIQVKIAPGIWYKNGNGYHAAFRVPMNQLERTDSPPLFYALAVRLDNGWDNYIVINRAKLCELWNSGCGSENEKSGDLELYIQFRFPDNENEPKMTAVCGDFGLTDYVNAWESLPPLKPPAAIDPELPQA